MPADALSDVLRAVQLTGSMFFRVRMRAPYAVSAKGAREMIEEYAPGVQYMLPFHLVTSGTMWCDVAGGDAVRLEAGDIIVLPGGAEHSLTDRPGTVPVPNADLQHLATGQPPTLDWAGVGEPDVALCGFIHCNGRLFNPLMASLPPVLVVRNGAERSPWLAATLQRAFDEAVNPGPGSDALIARLVEICFVEVITRHMEEGNASGWLRALGDPIAGPALACLHADPEREWTLESLAREVGASRSLLAERFTTAVGLSPIRYLTAWRMELAAQRLEVTGDPIAEIALASGYDSEAAFNRAFKRHTGEPPAAWRRRHRSARRPSAEGTPGALVPAVAAQ